jgi:thymidylate synthase
MIALQADSATRLWLRTVAALLARGTTCGPRGLKTLEVIDTHLVLTEPRRRLVSAPPSRVLNAAFAAAETVWILAGVDDDWIHTYNQRLIRLVDNQVLQGAYGPRLRSWAGRTDQLDQVRRELLSDPSSRRAVVQLWDPARDHQGHKDVPCTVGYWFVQRGGRLDMHTTMRSQDLWLGFGYDIFATTVIHELMAGWIGAELGTYHHHVGSLHLYDEHLDAARALSGEAVSDRDGPQTTQMPGLVLPWEELDPLLQAVTAGDPVDHTGWQEFNEVMASYRVYKSGDRKDARDAATQAAGPLGAALVDWYDHLDRASSQSSASGALPKFPERPR